LRFPYALALACAISLFSAIAAAPAVAATPPATLDGEVLFQNFPACSKNGGGPDPADCTAAIQNPPPRVVQGECNPTGNSTFSFQLAGIAAGPYSGTFTENVTVTVGPQTGPPLDGFGGPFTPSSFGFNTGPVLSWDASFTIYSGNYTVTGTKHLSAVAPTNIGFCAELDNQSGTIFTVPVTGFLKVANAANLSYDAKIHGADGGVYADTGNSKSIVREGFVYSAPNPTNDRVRNVMGEFGQSFMSTVAETGKPGLGCGDENHIHVRVGECMTLPPS
jgi:hypothetical protein